MSWMSEASRTKRCGFGAPQDEIVIKRIRDHKVAHKSRDASEKAVQRVVEEEFPLVGNLLTFKRPFFN